MRPVRLTLVLAVLLALAAPASAAFKDVLPGYLGSIVLVDTDSATGTAFAVESLPNLTRFLTNSHVVKGSTTVTLQDPTGKRVEARVVADDPAVDLALLEAAGVSVPALPLWSGTNPLLGSDLAVVGYPIPEDLQEAGMDVQPSVSKGILSAIRNTRSGVLFQVDVAINPGNSGGPAMDWETGIVLGVASSGMSGAEGINFLVGIPTVREFLANRPLPRPVPMAQSGAIDVVAALKQLGLKYEVDKDGDYRLLFDVGEGRSQAVYIRGKSEVWRGIRVLEIFSPALDLQGKLPPELASKLLLDSQNAKLGGWQMRAGPQIEYAVKVPDDLTPEQLQDLLEYVLDSADRLEREVTGTDEF